MNKYHAHARKFLRNCGATLKVKFLHYGKHFDDDQHERNVYNVTIKRNGQSYSFRFGDSVFNTRDGREPTEYCILACLQKYKPEADVWDFAAEYGYEICNRSSYNKILHTHQAVKDEYAGVMRVFGDVIEQLQEIQ